MEIAIIVAIISIVILPFLDKIIEYLYPQGDLAQSKYECDEILYEIDCTRVHDGNDN